MQKDDKFPSQSESSLFSPPRRGRVRVGVPYAARISRLLTPILTFPHQGGRNRIKRELPGSFDFVFLTPYYIDKINSGDTNHMTYSSFVFENNEGVATIRLNDPERLNALTFQTYGELEKIMVEMAHDNTVKVVVLTGTGKGFCSGGRVDDIIGPLLKMKGDELYKFTRMTCNVVKNMRNLKKPIIAAVNGIAAGAGAMLMLASDLRIFSDKARAAFLFVKVGLSGADMGALYLLPRIVGLGKATELVYFGDTVDAQEAYRIGLANRVVPGETLMDEAYKWANRLKDGPLYALGVTKELLEYEANVNLETALEMEAMAQARCMETPDFIEGYNAFVEKRPLKFNRG
jgi:enoyl-CoA hydratase/carnithine racemase